MSDAKQSSADPHRNLLAALKRGATIERMDYCGWRLFHKNGARGRTVFDNEVQDLIERGAIVRTDDRTSRIGEAYGIAPAPSSDETRL